MSKEILEAIESQEVMFYDDKLMAVLVSPIPNGEPQVYIPVKTLSDAMELSWSGQYERLVRDPVLKEELRFININSNGTQIREMVCLPLEYINGWLFSINASRVKAEIRERLIQYQRECYRVLANAFLHQTIVTSSSSGELQALQQIREMSLAIAAMAEQQIALTTRVDKAAIIVGQHEKRLNNIERQLAPRRAITDEQATDVANKVKALAMFMTDLGDGGKNHFQSIFSEIYRRYRVSSYKEIRQDQYQDVLDFLNEWHDTLQAKKGKS